MTISTKRKIAIASFISRFVRKARSLLGLKNKTQFWRRGIKWDLDLAQGIDLAIFLQGRFEPNTIKTYKKYLGLGFVVLDIGANIGAHTLPLASMVGTSGKVIAFEPTDYAFEKLQINLSLNELLSSRVTPIQALLVANTSKARPDAIPSSWSLDKGGQKDGNIHPIHKGTFNSLKGAVSIRLDDWFQRNPVGRIDFIKMDVDGFEIDVLEGAAQTLRTHRPVIVMELAPYIFKEKGRKFSELVNLLKKHRYSCSTFSGDPLALNESLEKKIGNGCSINVILKPI
jgi:FkbM family methyltransferase